MSVVSWASVVTWAFIATDFTLIEPFTPWAVVTIMTFYLSFLLNELPPGTEVEPEPLKML